VKIVIGLVVAAVSASCVSTAHQVTNEPAPVTVAIGRAAVAGLASSFESGGVVRAHGTALISSRVMAPITAVQVRPGDRVRRGAALVTLDAREIQANKTRAEASTLSASEAARAADGDVRGAESAVVLARATHERMATLHAKRSATTQELDQAVAALAAAEAQRTSAQARLASAIAARDAAQASSQSAAVMATYAVLTAPFDGVVAERRADPGSIAMPGEPLLVLEDPSTYRLELQLDEARAAFVSIGQTVPAHIDSAIDRDDGWVNGRVVEIGRVDSSSHAFVVKVDLPPSAMMRSGLFGRARFAAQSQSTLMVPTSALINRGQLTFVYLVDAGSRARLRPVSVGRTDRDRSEVLAGLHDGDAIVIGPPSPLTDGTRVTGVAQ
jgi:multidrug efflux pump subunit AcrA (membrane-fusion protein)